MKLIQAHAKVVSGFVERGFAEAMKNHAVPSDRRVKNHGASQPVITGHGDVVRLADAAMQPRSGTKLVIDVTRGGNPAVLNPDAYAKAFGTKDNPNINLLQQLHEANVGLYVCGQTLISKGSSPEDVTVSVETAVSALTAIVDLQDDGYAYVPLGN